MQMAIPIREQLDYQGMARRFFEIDVLAQGQIARYDKDISGFAAVMTKKGEVIDFITEGTYVEPTTWEIFSPNAIRLKEIQQRRFNVLDRMQEKIRIYVQLEEDTQFLALTATTVAANTGSTGNASGSSSNGNNKDFMNTVSTTIMAHDLPAYAYLMNFKTYAHIRSWQRNDLDPVTQREIQQTGLMGQIWGIDIIVSRLVPDGVLYCFSEPRFTGVFPIRTDLILIPDDTPKEATIGYVGYEEVGMTIVNANSVSYGNFTGNSYFEPA
jgi:hypothetical protein